MKPLQRLDVSLQEGGHPGRVRAASRILDREVSFAKQHQRCPGCGPREDPVRLSCVGDIKHQVLRGVRHEAAEPDGVPHVRRHLGVGAVAALPEGVRAHLVVAQDAHRLGADQPVVVREGHPVLLLIVDVGPRFRAYPGGVFDDPQAVRQVDASCAHGVRVTVERVANPVLA